MDAASILYGPAGGTAPTAPPAPQPAPVEQPAGTGWFPKAPPPDPAQTLYGAAPQVKPAAKAPSQAAGPSAADTLYGKPAQTPDPSAAPTTAPVRDAADTLYTEPMDGVSYNEASLNSPAEVQVDLPGDVAGRLDLTDLPQAKAAMVAAGIGHTLGVALVAQAAAAVRNPIQTTPEQAYAELQQRFGAQADAQLATAREMIDRAAQKWPGVHAFLDQSGLGNDPKLITRLAARAARLSKQ